MEGMFPGGWNSQIGTNNTEYYPDPVQSALEKKERRKKLFLVDGLVKGRPPIPNIILA